ncbi:hypothetical protein RO3G_11916 [Rhizopus delemar RA 99-880]|uniref:Uncharacterized protein n=1 Tax=Rhizopus delemar (strain RA 99-880 / ATCC MYA-4621 / FGSC 9543 / NRRL 43880) TaxID=246409 RepID=I1CFH5_RHIO9|nr:hypothetical protein RO3G_11916 [Rhizopus delemar RA 99-880]|eukprot:EIE87205.1 hypothetical protein RO3G_11916 [Rhizopus delemar RA 99-880]
MPRIAEACKPVTIAGCQDCIRLLAVPMTILAASTSDSEGMRLIFYHCKKLGSRLETISHQKGYQHMVTKCNR